MVSVGFDLITPDSYTATYSFLKSATFTYKNFSAATTSINYTCWKLSTIGLADNFYGNTAVRSSFEPGVNFKRLNLLSLNRKYTDKDLLTTASLTCNVSNAQYCSTDTTHFSCQPGYYLDVTTSTCNVDCPVGWMRLPNDIQNKDQEYCIKQCVANTATCPSLNAVKKNIATVFACSAGYYNYNYNCILNAKAQASKYYIDNTLLI